MTGLSNLSPICAPNFFRGEIPKLNTEDAGDRRGAQRNYGVSIIIGCRNVEDCPIVN
jgi:hypothetical protein